MVYFLSYSALYYLHTDRRRDFRANVLKRFVPVFYGNLDEACLLRHTEGRRTSKVKEIHSGISLLEFISEILAG